MIAQQIIPLRDSIVVVFRIQASALVFAFLVDKKINLTLNAIEGNFSSSRCLLM